MQVEKQLAPASAQSGDETYFFCSDRCHDRFVANPMRRTGMSEHIDPICGMTVEPDTAAAKREYAGKTYYFCGPGCAKAFDLKPEVFIDATRSA
jgi:Cu+-exporting ATPase